MTSDTTVDRLLEEYIGQARPTLVEFGRPGKNEDSDVMDALRDSLKGRANILTINGTESQDLMKTYKIDTYPTFVLFKDGAEAWRDSGRKSESELKDMLERFI